MGGKTVRRPGWQERVRVAEQWTRAELLLNQTLSTRTDDQEGRGHRWEWTWAHDTDFRRLQDTKGPYLALL